MSYVESLFRARLSGPFSDEAVSGILDVAAGWQESPYWAALIAVLRNWVLQPANRPREALALLQPWRHNEVITGYARFHVLAAVFHAQLRLGFIDDALVTADELHALTQSQTDRPWLMTYSELVFRHQPKISAGRDLDQLAGCVQAQLAEATAGGDASAQAVSAMVLGLLQLRRGHASQACILLGQAADRFETADPGFDAIFTLSQLAMASALCGDRERAERALRRAERSGHNQPRMLRRYHCELQHASILVAASNGSFSNKIERLFALADAGLEHPTEEADILYSALRCGARPARVASALARRARSTQNERIELMHAYAEALAGESANGLLEIARTFGARGLDLYAAEAAAGAARAHYAAGDMAAAGAAVALSRRHISDCGRVISPALLIPMMVPALTRRELEIARMAARGLSNRAIADALFVSVRTAESCVLRACRKLGVDGRKALAQILSLDD